MSSRIKSDVVKALDDWNAGKPVRSIELGHTHRMTHSEEYMQSNPNARNSVDLSKRLSNDQERAHAYVFHLIELFKLNGVPQDHETFLGACDDFDLTFPDAEHLTEEEKIAGRSLAWKALLVGWARAIDGHREARYIEVSRPQVAAT
jgi:hypothetical protein